MSILVTGGAGYIGSVTCELLRASGESLVVLDNLSRGHRTAVDESIPFYQGDVGDTDLVKRLVTDHSVDACVHFAAFAFVDESVRNPELYYRNNIEQGIRLLDALHESGVARFVFSSSCATYGEPREIPISEDHPLQPANPYGWSKLMIERVLEDYSRAHKLRFVALRYFNAAGATETRGEHHDPETHLIPNILFAARGTEPVVRVFGSDYPTPDGTAIRDYVHVSDLARAHALALTYLRGDGNSTVVNLGTGRGQSVMEVIEAARAVTGLPIEVQHESRRPGDPAQLISAAALAREVLGWEPTRTDLEETLRSAWEWFERHPHGYLKKAVEA